MQHNRRYHGDQPGCWGLHGFVLYAMDGSRIDLPGTASYQEAYLANRKQKRKKGEKGKKNEKKTPSSSHSRKADSPQIWVTTMLYIGTGLPWDWRTGPSDCSERAHFIEMLASLPLLALVAGDCGFAGYEY